MPRANKGAQIWRRKDTGKWGVGEYVKGQRHWIISGLGSQQEAERELVKILIERRQGQCPDNEITVGEIMANYLTNHIPHTARPDNGLYCHEALATFWASMKVTEVNKSKCQAFCQIKRSEYMNKTGKTLSNETIRRHLEHLIAAFNYANDNGVISFKPTFWKPEKAKACDRWLTRSEVARLLKVSPPHIRMLIMLGVYTGARKGALLNLTWDKIDLENGFIDYRDNQRSKNKGYALVAIPRALNTYLKPRKRDVGYVITIDGSYIKNPKKAWKAACLRAGIEADMKSLRHTCGSWLKQSGIPSAFIGETLGHTDTKMIDNVYGHMDKAYLNVIKNATFGKVA